MHALYLRTFRLGGLLVVIAMLASSLFVPAIPASAAQPTAVLPPAPPAAAPAPDLATQTQPCQAHTAQAATPDETLARGTLAGTLSTADGKTLADLEVLLLSEPDERIVLDTTRSDASGNYAFTRLDPGTYTLVVLAPEGYPLPTLEDATATLAPQQAGGTRLDLTLPPLPTSDTLAAPVAGDDPVLAQTGAITGVVTAADTGDPLSNVAVRLFDSNGDNIESVNTGIDGDYILPDLAVDEYRVQFVPQQFANPARFYAPEFYDGQTSLATATTISVTEDITVTNINATLDFGGALTGVVSTSDTLQPLSSVTVRAYDSTDTLLKTDINDSFTGVYSITGLAAGNYRIEFDPSGSTYAPEFFDNQTTLANADPVAVTLGDVTTIDAALDRGGVLTGTVTGADTGEPLQSVNVRLYNEAGDQVSSDFTSGTGQYLFQGVGTGTYRVQFDAPFGSPYIDEFFDNQPTLEAATPFSITVNTTQTINAELDRGGVLAGTVTGADTGNPLENVSVRLYNEAGDQIASESTDSNGVYTIAGQPTGTYRVGFEASFASPYIDEFFDNQPTLEAATPFSLTVNLTETINAELDRGGVLAGTVTGADTGEPLENVSVRLYNEAGQIVRSDSTDANGIYTLGGQPSGTYRVGFDAPFNSGYLEEFFDNQPTLEAATPFSLTVNLTETIDAELDRGATLQGTVTGNDTGDPLENISVRLINANGLTEESDTTDDTGTYSITGIVAGDYRIRFDPPFGSPYLEEFHDNKESPDTADPVTLNLNTVTTIDAGLDRGGGITGRVTDSGGDNVEDVRVQLLNADGGSVDDVNTAADGTYQFTGLAAQGYRIEFDPPNDSPLLGEYYDNAARLGVSTLITTTLAVTTTGINAQLETGGTISGRVTDEDTGLPIEGAFVSVGEQCGLAFKSTTTDENGAYTVRGLPTGNYRVEFSSQNYLSEYYDNQPNSSNAALVPVNAPEIVANINAALTPGSTVSGVVTAADTGGPLRNLSVQLLTPSGSFIDSGSPNASGIYTITGVPSGTYVVEFDPSSFGDAREYQSEYFTNTRTLDTATPINVGRKATITGINAQLERGGTLSGTITAADSGQPLEDIDVTLQTAEGGFIASNSFAPDGEYTFTGLSAGEYRIEVEPDEFAGSDAFSYTLTTSEPATVTVPQTTTLDVQVQRGGQISGTVTAADTGQPLSNVQIEVFDSNGNDADFFLSTNTDGKFITPGLPAGSYTVQYEPFSGDAADYIEEFYDNQPASDTATPVNVTVGNITTDINAVLERGGRINGVVTDAVTGQPVDSVDVRLLDAATGNIVQRRFVSSFGVYHFRAVPPGQYQIEFDPQDDVCFPPYAGEFYNDKPDQATADILTITGTMMLDNINAALQPASTLSGRVTAEDTSQPLSNVDVRVFNSDEQQIASGTTNSSGEYITGGIISGTYTVEFDPEGNNNIYVAEFFDSKLFRDEADPVVIGTTPRTGFDAVLQRGGQISGTVTTADTSLPLEDVGIDVVDLSTGTRRVVESASTDSDGTYLTEGIPAGSYVVEIDPTNGQGSASLYAVEYFNNKPDAASADPVTVVAGSVTPNINAQLERRVTGTGSIAGVVTGDDAPQGLADVTVTVFDSAGRTAGITTTTTSGLYTVAGLVTDTYRVGFTASGYTSEFFNDKPTLATADLITVTDGSAVSNINAVLALQAEGITGVTIAGPTEGEIGSTASFTATVQPANATPPFTVTWSATNQPPVAPRTGITSVSDSISFAWSVSGIQTVAVTVTDRLGNVVNDTAQINISAGQQSEGFIVTPEQGATVPLTGTNGQRFGAILFPVGSVPFTVEVRYTTRQQPSQPLPPGRANIARAFGLEFFNPTTGEPLPDFSLSSAITVEFVYAPTLLRGATLAVVPPETVRIFALQGTTWGDATDTCTPPSTYQRSDGLISVAACAGDEFALTDQTQVVYLPIVVRAAATR